MLRNWIVCVLLTGGLQGAEVGHGIAAKNIQTVHFLSESLGEQRAFNIFLPSDYDSSDSRYPTLYLLHGYGDDNTAWSYMTNLSGFGQRHRVIIVMPDGSKSWYVNSASDPKAKFEDFITKDLVNYVDSRYRTIPLPRARAIAGLSMGGYGATFLGLKHYRQFSAIGSFSGAVGINHQAPAAADAPALRDPAFVNELNHVFGADGSPERQQRDPFALIEKLPASDVPLLYIACGGEDFLIEQNRAFVKALADKKIPYEYREISPRVHSWDFWDDQLRVFLDKLDQKPGFNAD